MKKNSTPAFPLLHLQPGAACMLSHEKLSMVCYLASLLEQAQREAAIKAATSASVVTPPSRVVVMLADDDVDDRDLFEEVITEINSEIELKAVEDGFELMKVLHASTDVLPALIFLDLNMPGKSGKQCLEEIKTNSRLSAIPVVIYSTSTNKKDIQETHGIGASRYVSKPNTFRGLISVVEKVFSLDLEKLKSTPPIHDFVLSE